MADEIIVPQVSFTSPIRGLYRQANTPTLVVKDTSVPQFYDLVINVGKDQSTYLDASADYWIIWGFNLSHYLSNNGYDPALARNITVNFNGGSQPGDRVAVIGHIGGYKYAFDTGDDVRNANITVNCNCLMLGLGGSRYSERNGIGTINGGACVRVMANNPLNFIIKTSLNGDIKGGGGAGEGRVNGNYAYAGGGAPYGRGWGGGDDASLLYGGSQDNAIGNDGGNAGQNGSGSGGGVAGPFFIGDVDKVQVYNV